MTDAINPQHYKRLPAEAIEIILSAIDDAPSKRAAYLHGQTLKYVLRCWNKNGIEDLRKAKWYLDRLVDSLDEWEKQKAADIQSLKDHPFGKPKWKPKIGDWVRIKKPESNPAWMPGMDKYDGQLVEVKEIDDDPSTHDDWAYIGKAIVHDEWCFMFDWLKPAEAPLNSDTIPKGYRKLNDSSVEPRQPGDLRWSVSEKRYIPISSDVIGYANRDNWAACRKITREVTGEATVEVKPPDGWRFLEHGEVIRNGDRYFDERQWKDRTWAIEETYSANHQTTIRRNRFEVGEKVVEVVNSRIGVVKGDEATGKSILYHVEMQDTKGRIFFSPHQIAPYIEDAK